MTNLLNRCDEYGGYSKREDFFMILVFISSIFASMTLLFLLFDGIGVTVKTVIDPLYFLSSSGVLALVGLLGLFYFKEKKCRLIRKLCQSKNYEAKIAVIVNLNPESRYLKSALMPNNIPSRLTVFFGQGGEQAIMYTKALIAEASKYEEALSFEDIHSLGPIERLKISRSLLTDIK